MLLVLAARWSLQSSLWSDWLCCWAQLQAGWHQQAFLQQLHVEDWSGGGSLGMRGHWGHQACLWHLGWYSEWGEQDGLHWPPGIHPGMSPQESGNLCFNEIFLNFSVQASEKVALIVGERGYAVKERGIINVKGKGNMKTYFILGRKISRRIGRGSGAANNNLAEVVYGMVRARRRRTFKRDKDNLERLESGASSDRVSESGDGRSSYKKSDGSSKLSRRNPISRSIRRSVVSVKVETQVWYWLWQPSCKLDKVDFVGLGGPTSTLQLFSQLTSYLQDMSC